MTKEGRGREDGEHAKEEMSRGSFFLHLLPTRTSSQEVSATQQRHAKKA